MAKKPVKKTKAKRSLPAKKAGSDFAVSIKRRSMRRSHRVTLTIVIPRLHIKWPHIARQKPSSIAFTGTLLAVSTAGFMFLAQPLFAKPAIPVSVPAPKAQSSRPAAPKALGPSAPTLLEIPAIGLGTQLEKVGKNSDGTIHVPSQADTAGWYALGPTPGEIGPAVIVGHLDSMTGAAVFYNLNKLVPGDEIRVARADGSMARFKVDKLEEYPQTAFATTAVYGPIDYAGLRLITCSGSFNLRSRHYSHNIVVYASLAPQ
jgi:hypothetical protein